MNIKDKLTCKCCNEILKNPITLNCCGDNICQQHLNELISSNSSNRFMCPLCNKENLNQLFHINNLIQSLLEVELHMFKINPIYDSVLNNLKKEIGNLVSILKDPENYIYEEISELKRQVDLDRERLKIQIDELANDLIQQLESYEKRFKSEYKAKVDLEHYNGLVESSKKQLVEYERCLSLFSIEKEDRYAKRIESEKMIDKLRPEIKELKEKLLANLSISYRPMEKTAADFFGKLTVKVRLEKIIKNVYFLKLIFHQILENKDFGNDQENIK